MEPPTSRYYPPVPDGRYPQQYPQPYPPHQNYPYPGQYYYPPQPPPPGGSTGKLITIIVVILAVVVIIPVILAGILTVYLQSLPASSNTVETTLGLDTGRKASGDWQIDVTSGSASASSVTITVVDTNTGATAYSSGLTAMNTVAGMYNDNNGNNMLDPGDTVLIQDTASVDPGMKVLFLKGENVIGVVIALPA